MQSVASFSTTVVTGSAPADWRDVFVTDDGVHGQQIRSTDGTSAGTELLATVDPGAEPSGGALDPQALAPSIEGASFAAGDAAFVLYSATLGQQLWKSDGATATLVLTLNSGPGNKNSSTLSFSVNGNSVFATDDGVHGQKIWASDGTTAGTTLVATANSGTEAAGSEFVPSDIGFTGSGDGLIVLYDQTIGQELWLTDGTVGGTHVVANLEGAPGVKSYATQGLTLASGMQVFAIDDGVHGQQIWTTDGTSGATRMLASVRSVIDSTGPDHDPVILGYATLDGAFDTSRVSFSLEDGQELWVTDGTAAGTEEIAPVCYLKGSRIATPGGEVAVEHLWPGDMVTTLGRALAARGTRIRTPTGELQVEKLRPGKQVQEVPQTIRWLGHRQIDLTTHLHPETVAPIRIERDAIADGLPHHDLLVSPDHGIFVDGKLICARQLVNGVTIRQELDWTAVDYYHVELDQHAILLAEGLPAESYLDTGNRGFFSNSDEPLVLHPDLTDKTNYPTREAGSCAPFVWDEANVRPIWQCLADRAAAISQSVSQQVTTTDADLRLLADRRTVKPVVSDSDRVIFVLPHGAREVRLVSHAQSPTEARPWLEDRRRLGVRVKRIMLRGADELREVPVDHPDLTRGWWAVERDGRMISRWTDGEAVLPLPEMSGHVMLEIHLAGSMIYAVGTAPEGGMEQRAAA